MNAAEKPGYSGTAILTKVEPLDVRFGIGHDAHDAEGRVITAEFKDFYLVNVYVPNSKRDLLRLDYRVKSRGPDFSSYMKGLEEKKPVVFCGDLNVAHKEIDLARPKPDVKNAGFTPEERASFDTYIASGFLDTFREFQTAAGHYTWWSYMGTARQKNIGWRIDYFLHLARVASAAEGRLYLAAHHGQRPLSGGHLSGVDPLFPEDRHADCSPTNPTACSRSSRPIWRGKGRWRSLISTRGVSAGLRLDLDSEGMRY